MRPLNRPMFRYGGPIKEGIMDGIREPKKNGGPTGTGLVGDQRYPKTNGREHHALFIPPAIAAGMGLARLLPMARNIYQGFRGAQTFAPGKLGTFGRIKDIFSPSGRFRNVTQSNVAKQGNILTDAQIKAGMIPSTQTTRLGTLTALRDPKLLGAAIRENPVLAFSLASALPQGAVGTYKAAIAAGKSAPELAKLYVDLVLPGEQFREKDGSAKTDASGVSNINKVKAAIGMPENLTYRPPTDASKKGDGVEMSPEEKRAKNVERYRDIMDIKGMNKKAAYNSLIEASRLINESGDFKGDIKSGRLINQIIGATSKAFDKPAQTKDAIDTLILKGEIEKDLNKEKNALDNEYKRSAIALNEAKIAQDSLMGDRKSYLEKNKALPSGQMLAGLARNRGYQVAGIEDVTEVKNWMKENGKDEVEYLKDIMTKTEIAPGIYVINTRLIQVTEDNKLQEI